MSGWMSPEMKAEMKAALDIGKLSPLELVEGAFRGAIVEAIDGADGKNHAAAQKWLDLAERLTEIRAKLVTGPVFDAADPAFISAQLDSGEVVTSMPALNIKGVSFYEDGDELGWGYTCHECERHVAGVAKTEGYEYARGWLAAVAEAHAFEVHLPGPENRRVWAGRGPLPDLSISPEGVMRIGELFEALDRFVEAYRGTETGLTRSLLLDEVRRIAADIRGHDVPDVISVGSEPGPIDAINLAEGLASITLGESLWAMADSKGRSGPVGKVVRIRETLNGNAEVELEAEL